MNRSEQQVIEIVANLDDATGEVIGHAVEALLAAGALDCWTTPIMMKKRRPGVQLSVLVPPEVCDAMARRVIELTGSFGVRYRGWDRLVLDRRHETVCTPFGEVRVKIGSLDGREVVRKVEFDDAAKAAAKHGAPLRTVIEAALKGTGDE
ncbi:MAG: nickel pincer cofactor biosynthesis protein LarC2 [Phycisphaerales bacterium]